MPPNDKPTTNNSATRETITVEWNGTEPLQLPRAFPERPAPILQPGTRGVLRMDYFHALGRFPEIVEHIAHGRLKPVCTAHIFVEGEKVCASCHFTREMAAEERAAANPKKAPAQPAPAVVTPAPVPPVLP